MRCKLFTAAAVCAGALWPSGAEACSCLSSGLPCNAVWRVDAVFVGRVVSVESSIAPADRSGRRVELQVAQAFRGLASSPVTVLAGFGTCGYSFRVGEAYIVYALRMPNGHLTTSICSRTRPVAQAAEDLAYGRSLAAFAPGAPARLAGQVQLWEYPLPPGGQLRRVPGVAVTATGHGRTFTTRANDRGEFELTGLLPGKYDVIADAPDGYYASARPVEVHDPRGCGTEPVYIGYDGRVRGRVVDHDGRGIGGLALGLVSRTDISNGERVQAWTTTDGTFELRRVSPGEYLLGFYGTRSKDNHPLPWGRGFYPGASLPGDAKTIVVNIGDRLELADFVLPDNVRFASLNGLVVDDALRPVRDAIVRLRSDQGNTIGPPFTTGVDGRFDFALIEGGRYEVNVTRYAQPDAQTPAVRSRTVRLTAASGSTPIVVQMKPNEY
jgi:hypothetical protein